MKMPSSVNLKIKSLNFGRVARYSVFSYPSPGFKPRISHGEDLAKL